MSGNRREFHMRHLENEPHAVYIVWNEDVPVYVGMTSNWPQRTSSHTKRYLKTGRATHIDVWLLNVTRSRAEQIEAQTIRALDPTDNVVHSPTAEQRAMNWAEYSRWSEAYRRYHYDNRITWAREPEALDRALEILIAEGYSGEQLRLMHPTGEFSARPAVAS